MRALALALLALPVSAWPADWVRVPAAGADGHLYDRSNLVLKADEVTYWRKVVFSKPVRVRSGIARSAIYQEQIHCREHTLRTLTWQLFADEGAVIESSAVADAEPSPIVPETIGDRFHAAMCELVEAKRRRDADVAREEAQLNAKRKELEALRAEIERLEASVLRLRSEAVPAMPSQGDQPEGASQ